MMHHLHTCAYCEVYLSFDEFNGKCILDEGGVGESLHKKSQIVETHVHDEMPTAAF